MSKKTRVLYWLYIVKEGCINNFFNSKTCQNSKEPPAGLSRDTQPFKVAVDLVCVSACQ